MILGITSTRKGLTDQQKDGIVRVVQKLNAEDRITAVHHGDCTGGDEEIHNLLLPIFGNIFWLHPASDVDKRFRAFCKPYAWKFPPLPALQRNHNIVEAADVMIGCPKEKVEVWRGGTWATIHYAQKRNVPTTVIWPHGGLWEFNRG